MLEFYNSPARLFITQFTQLFTDSDHRPQAHIPPPPLAVSASDLALALMVSEALTAETLV